MSNSLFEIRDGNLLDAKETCICHQCNCVSHIARGLASELFEKYPYANTYYGRNATNSNLPGTVDVCGASEWHQNVPPPGPVGIEIGSRIVMNMYAQRYPGIPKYDNDTADNRVLWFKECLKKIAALKNIASCSLAFAHGIACGYGGGDWAVYEKVLRDFSVEHQIHVVLYKHEKKPRDQYQESFYRTSKTHNTAIMLNTIAKYMIEQKKKE